MRSGFVTLRSGEQVGEHSTKDHEEILVIVEGTGEVEAEGYGRRPVKAGQVVFIPPDDSQRVQHRLRAAAVRLHRRAGLVERSALKRPAPGRVPPRQSDPVSAREAARGPGSGPHRPLRRPDDGGGPGICVTFSSSVAQMDGKVNPEGMRQRCFTGESGQEELPGRPGTGPGEPEGPSGWLPPPLPMTGTRLKLVSPAFPAPPA